MDINEVKQLLEKYNITSIDELEYYLNQDIGKDECIDDENVEIDKYCTKRQCYEDTFVPDCRKIIEIYNKYFQDDFKSKKLFIEYLAQCIDKKNSSLENYMSCKSCNQQIKNQGNICNNLSGLKISDSEFKRDFCNNLNIKFNYTTLFGRDYISIKQFLSKEHQVTRDTYEPSFKKEDEYMTKDEKQKLFDLTHVSREELKINLSNPENIEGSNDYKMNLVLAAFERNLVDESYRLINELSEEETLKSNNDFLLLKAKVYSNKKMDKEAIEIIEEILEATKPNVDVEVYNLLAASIKREAFIEYEKYGDENILLEKLIKSQNIYHSVYQLNHDYYPALNYMYLKSMISYIQGDNSLNITDQKKEFEKIWMDVDHKINDWWSFIAEIEYLIILEKYQLAKEKLNEQFSQLDDIEISDFNISSTIRQLNLYSKFYSNTELNEIINFLENIKK